MFILIKRKLIGSTMSHIHPTTNENIFHKIVEKYNTNINHKKTSKNFKIKVLETECILDFRSNPNKNFLEIKFPNAVVFKITNFKSIKCIKENNLDANTEIQTRLYETFINVDYKSNESMIHSILEYLHNEGERNI